MGKWKFGGRTIVSSSIEWKRRLRGITFFVRITRRREDFIRIVPRVDDDKGEGEKLLQRNQECV